MEIMAEEEASRPSSPLQEIQRTFFECVQENIFLKDELKKSQEKISQLETQVEAANETIQKQQAQLLEAADIIKEVETFANKTIQELRKQLEDNRKKDLEREAVIENESDLNEKSNSESHNNSVGIIIVSNPNPISIDNNNPTGNNNQSTIELQSIVSNLHKNANELGFQEKRKKRRKVVNQIIDHTTHLVGCLSSIIDEEVKNKIGSHLPPQTSSECDRVGDDECTIPQDTSSSRPISTDLKESTNSFLVPMTPKHGFDFEKSLHCVCGHKSINKSALFKHIKVKCQGNPFLCEMCSHRVRDTTALNLHYRRVHQVNRNYANGCAKCGNMYDTRKDLLRHKYQDMCNNFPKPHD